MCLSHFHFFATFSMWVKFIKNLLSGEQILSLTVDLHLEGLFSPWKQSSSNVSCFPLSKWCMNMKVSPYTLRKEGYGQTTNVYHISQFISYLVHIKNR